MGFKSFFKELKRRNIYKVAASYGITGWIVIQIATTVFPAFDFPHWTIQFVIILTLIGFPISLVLAWAFEITPNGIKKTPQISEIGIIEDHAGVTFNYWVIGLLSFALLLALTYNYWFVGSFLATKNKIMNKKTASVAVLPFKDFSPHGNQEWFSDGLSEELLNSLARLSELKVTARTSSFLFKNTTLPIPKIADSLHVNHIVEGSVLRDGKEMRITAQLIRASDGTDIWSKTYDRHVDSVLEVQKDIAEQIASALNVYLNDSKRKRMFSIGTQNVDAYKDYLKGLKIFNRAHITNPVNDSLLWIANKWFEKATKLDPHFSAAYYHHQDVYAHYLMSYNLNKVNTLEPKVAYRLMHSDLDMAINYSKNKGQKLFYRFDNAFLSHRWNQLPQILKKINQSNEAHFYYGIESGGWASTVASFLGYAKLIHELSKIRLRNDPLSRTDKIYDGIALTLLGKTDSALTRLQGSYAHSIIYLLANKPQKAKKALSQKPNASYPVLSRAVKVLLGTKKITDKELDDYAQGINPANRSSLIFLYFAAGNQKKADELAHHVDATYFGPQKLFNFLILVGIIPFDLNITPNLKARLQEAGVDFKTVEFAGRKVKKIVQKDF